MAQHSYDRSHEAEYAEFDRLLTQDEILQNLVVTGLRGVGKTVLLETFKPRALDAGWLWASADLSESADISETALAQGLLADLALVSAISHQVLVDVYNDTPGLVAGKIEAALEFAWLHLKSEGQHRIIFAYDEAQNLSEHAAKEQFPLSVLLDVFQSIQKKGIPFMLVLVGLPTLFPKLVDARTYAERMFRVMIHKNRLGGTPSQSSALGPGVFTLCGG